MDFLEDLPYSLSRAGPSKVDGVGNYYLQIMSRQQVETPLVTLYLLDSHGQVPSPTGAQDYGYITQSQIDWFSSTAKSLKSTRLDHNAHDTQTHRSSLAFMHIPFPEYGDESLIITAGKRREPTEGPSFNSHFYDVLAHEGVVAVGCGHDHLNDFCGVLPSQPAATEGDQQLAAPTAPHRPWLCYAGGIGFGAYGSYGGTRYQRRARLWEFDAQTQGVKTWKRVQYSADRVDEIVLAERGSNKYP